MFDLHGCGHENLSREAIESDLEARLAASGWGNRVATVVLNPELEVWVWSDSPRVAEALGWSGQNIEMRAYLSGKSFLFDQEGKPANPKGAVEEALKKVKKTRSASIYLELGKNVGHRRCTDPAFLKFKSTLQSWFPAD